MSDKIHKRIKVELEQLNLLIGTYQELLTKCHHSVPNPIELSALGAMLHAFYSGIENIFKRIAMEVDQSPPQGEGWHRGLLRTMTQPNSHRPALISKEMETQLFDYLKFRHFFRNAYSFELEWKQMSSLATGCEKTLRQLEKELLTFLNTGGNKH